jgi:acetyl-CoA carboxylase biotin carboxyl carrier protein
MIKKKAGAKKPTSAAPAPLRGSFGDLDFEAVRELARIATEFDLAEVETDPSGRIRVARRVERVGAVSAPVVSAPAPSGLSLMAPPAAEKAAETGALITSPFVGTFYRSPSPEAPAFVDVGQTVRKGQVVCIVEAMKLMNEIESDLDGKILDVLVKNGAHVEYGQPLFRIEKS